MGNKIAVTDNGKHKIGKKIFLTDENLVHRKAKKAFLTKNGVHRLVFSSGSFWNKYNCAESTKEVGYTEVDSIGEAFVGETYAVTFYRVPYSSDYYFDENNGFMGVGGGYVASADGVDSIGGYMVFEEEVCEITSVQLLSSVPFTVELTLTRVALCAPVTEDILVKGDTHYGSFEVEEGELPESGKLIEGSATDSYCILDVGGTYYYYVRGE